MSSHCFTLQGIHFYKWAELLLATTWSTADTNTEHQATSYLAQSMISVASLQLGIQHGPALCL